MATPNFIHLFENSIFHEINSSYWGYPHLWGGYTSFTMGPALFLSVCLEDLEKIWFNDIVFIAFVDFMGLSDS